jgi:hypothetical protein
MRFACFGLLCAPQAAIKELHRKFQDKNTLLAWAVNPEMRVAFDHWRGEAQGRDSDGKAV